MGMYDGESYKGAVPYSSYVPHLKVVSTPSGESRTRQEFADECDINSIMARFEKHKVLTHVNRSQGKYLDVSETPDLATALSVLADAETAFMSLPARVRAEFANDPISFVEFAQNVDNRERMREWGLLAPEKPVEAPMKVEVINPALEPSKSSGGRRKASDAADKAD